MIDMDMMNSMVWVRIFRQEGRWTEGNELQSREDENYYREEEDGKYEVKNKLVQDRSSKQVLVGSDIEALYSDTQAAEIIFKGSTEVQGQELKELDN